MQFRDRLEEMLALEEDEELPRGSSGGEPQRRRMPWLRWAAILVVVLTLLALGVWWRRRRFHVAPLPVLLEMGMRRLNLEPPGFIRRWARLARLEPVQRAYLQVDRALLRLGVSPEVADTASERTAALASVLPVATEPAYQLLAEYHSATYSPRFYKAHTAQEAARTIRRLSREAKLRRLIGREVVQRT
jgi:hypothetical protein